MTIRDYIQDQVFGRRAKEHSCLVIYDPARRYREIVLALESEHCRVIDVAKSVVEQRELANDAFADLVEGRIHQLVIWVPAVKPIESEARQRDPFAVFGLTGAEFPAGDGDDYASLCRRAKPDHVTEINRLFEEGEPSFEVVDALDEGGSWPKLKTLLNANSPKEILLGLLVPNAPQHEALKNDPTWVAEAREFFQRSLGHRLKTKGLTQASIADELWRVLLMSEFAFDSGSHLPAALESVPKATLEAKGLVYDTCDELRSHDGYKHTYTSAALEIEAEFNLRERCCDMTYLGDRDTFAFEERFYLSSMVRFALNRDLEKAKSTHETRRKSIWLSHEERLVEWSLAARALDLLDATNRLSAPKFATLESIVHGYATTWRELDRYHRQMEQAVNDWEGDNSELDSLVTRARLEYFASVEALQAEFIRLVKAEGWPATGSQIIWNSQVFAKMVAPALEAGERVAYFLVDSLRYELGIELEKRLSDKQPVSITTVCAQLPTYTEVGMASLMPDADSALKLVLKDGKLVTTLGGQIATNPATRLVYLQSRKGDQCSDIELEELVRLRKPKIPDKTRLLVVRTHDIDAIAHSSPRQVLSVIPELVRQIIRGLAKVAELGFEKAIVATDHGFLLFHDQAAGDVASRPSGKWLIEKSRCLLGAGQADGTNIVLKRGDVGIPGDFEDFAAPKALVPYSRGQIYYHEGLSLQECVLPCLTVRLSPPDKKAKQASVPRLTLSYRQGKSDRVTSRRPVVDLSWPEGNLFAEDNQTEIAIEATDSKGSVVGRVGAGPSVNDATGCVIIRPGAAIGVSLRMDDDFSGNFTVRAYTATTNVTLADLSLKTAYLE